MSVLTGQAHELTGRTQSLPARWAARGCPLVLAAWAAAACGADVSFSSQFAPGFAPAHHAVSVFGVYKDGQMNSGGWDAIEPRIARALGQPRCAAGYTETLASTNIALSSAIEDYARANGPTDDLLGQVAPAALGDLVLVITFAGKLPQHETAPDNHQGGASIGGGAGGGRGGMGGGPPRGPVPVASTDELDLSASLFSVSAAQSVALVAMRYRGTSVDEAVSKLAAKLGEAIPGAKCAGWNWNAKVDANRIRHGMDQP